MRVPNIIFLAVVLFAVSGCVTGSHGHGVTVGLPYCFVEESANQSIAERIGRIIPIDLDQVLLFPVVTRGIINGKNINYGIGSPLLYKPGTDVESLIFKGVEKWPVKRYMVWVRGYYMEQIPRLFLYSDTIWGRKCLLVELTPVKPGTDQRKMGDDIIRELKKKEIIVKQCIPITDEMDYAQLIQASALTSWMRDPLSGYKREIGVWDTPGWKIQIMLTDDDFELIESYLRGEKGGKR
ncbi:MAG: hypothetical protein WCO56_12025 [Verrucomicrobiota bacterium]